MEFSDGFVSEAHRELHRSASESADPLSVSPIQVKESPPKSPRSPKSQSKASPSSKCGGSGKPRSPLKHDRHSHSPKSGQPKKGTQSHFQEVKKSLNQLGQSFLPICENVHA